MIPLPRHTTWIDDTEKGTSVFVPSIMGVGVLLSLGILVADGVNKVRGDRGKVRERQLISGYIAGDVLSSVHDEDSSERGARGLRSRSTYVFAALVFIVIGVYGLFGSFWNYINPVDDGWVEDIAWVWAVSLLAVGGMLALGLLLGYIALVYPTVPSWLRRFLARTPIGVAPKSESSVVSHQSSVAGQNADA
jgi:hypothetical protein